MLFMLSFYSILGEDSGNLVLESCSNVVTTDYAHCIYN